MLRTRVLPRRSPSPPETWPPLLIASETVDPCWVQCTIAQSQSSNDESKQSTITFPAVLCNVAHLRRHSFEYVEFIRCVYKRNFSYWTLSNIPRLIIQRTHCNTLYAPQWLQQNDALKPLRVNYIRIQYSEPQMNCQELRVCVQVGDLVRVRAKGNDCRFPTAELFKNPMY